MESFNCVDLEAAISLSKGWMKGKRGMLRSVIAEDQSAVIIYRGNDAVAIFHVNG